MSVLNIYLVVPSYATIPLAITFAPATVGMNYQVMIMPAQVQIMFLCHDLLFVRCE